MPSVPPARSVSRAINPAGIDTGFIGLVISGVVAFVLALVAAMAIGTRKDEGGKALNISVD